MAPERLQVLALCFAAASSHAQTDNGASGVIDVPVRGMGLTGNVLAGADAAGRGTTSFVYSNFDSFSGQAFAHGTNPVYDQVVPVDAGGSILTAVAFSISNQGTLGTYIGGEIDFYIAEVQPDLSLGISRRLTIDLASLFPDLSVPPGQVSLLQISGFGPLEITLPDEQYYLGLAFREPAGAQSVEVLGQGVLSPPTIGISGDFFLGPNGLTNFGGSPAANFAWRVTAEGEPFESSYSFDAIPLPDGSSAFTHPVASVDINASGEVVVGYELGGEPFAYIGTSEEGRQFELLEPSSSGSVGPLSINDDGLAVYSVPFTTGGAERGVYGVSIDGGPSALLTSPDFSQFLRRLYVADDGWIEGAANTPGDSGEDYLVTFEAGIESEPVLLAVDSGIDPFSDLVLIERNTVDISQTGSIAGLVFPVSGGEELRLYNRIGQFQVLAQKRSIDPASPIICFGEFSRVGLNRKELVVFVAASDGGNGIFAASASGPITVAEPATLTAAGITLASSDDISSNDQEQFVFVASRAGVASKSVFVGTLEGTFEEVLRTPATLSTIDDQSIGIEDIVGDPAINNSGEIVIVTTQFLSGAILSKAVVARPASSACPADTNGDSVLAPADFNAWILAFNRASPHCDQNGDGLCMPDDFNAWVLNYNAGCVKHHRVPIATRYKGLVNLLPFVAHPVDRALIRGYS